MLPSRLGRAQAHLPARPAARAVQVQQQVRAGNALGGQPPWDPSRIRGYVGVSGERGGGVQEEEIELQEARERH